MPHLFLTVHFQLLDPIAMAWRGQLHHNAIDAGTVQSDLHVLAYQVDVKLGGLNARVSKDLHELVGVQATPNPIGRAPMPEVLELQQRHFCAGANPFQAILTAFLDIGNTLPQG